MVLKGFKGRWKGRWDLPWKIRAIKEYTRFNTGSGLVGTMKTMVSIFLLVAIYLELIGVRPSKGLIIAAFIIYIISNWLIGYLWDYWELYRVQAEFNNERDEFKKEVREFIDTFK